MISASNPRPLIGVSASVHDFGDYGGVGVHRPVLDGGGLPVALPQLVDAIGPACLHGDVAPARKAPQDTDAEQDSDSPSSGSPHGRHMAGRRSS